MADQEWTDLEAEAEELRADEVPPEDPRWADLQRRIDDYRRTLRES